MTEGFDMEDGFVPTSRIQAERWLADTTIDVGRFATAAGLTFDAYAAVIRGLEARGLCWIERGLDRDGRKTDRVRVRAQKATDFSELELRVIASMESRSTSGSLGRRTAQEALRATRSIQTIVTPEGPITVIRTVAAQLLKAGVVTGALDGTLRAGAAATVKAAILASAVCDFCSAMGAAHTFDVPNFEMPLGAGMSIGGWAACDACAALVRANSRKGLMDRALASLAFAKFTRPAIAEMFARFWRGMDEKAEAAGAAGALADFVEGRFSGSEVSRLDKPIQAALSDRDTRIAYLARVTGLTRDELEAATRGEVGPEALAKIARWHRSIPPSELRTVLAGGMVRPPAPASLIPHWQQALDAKYAALAGMIAAARGAKTVAFPDATDLNDPAAVQRVLVKAKAAAEFQDMDFESDVRLLRAAEAFSFNADTTAAIREATRSIPHDAPLSSVEAPTGCGWFWFAEPLPIVSASLASDVTHALLWGWTDRRGPEVALQFATYVRDREGRVTPAVRWYWPLSATLHEMLAIATRAYRAAYGPGGRFAEADGIVTERAATGEKQTLEAIADLSLFFLAACVWFKQKIVVASDGHVERHARKRMQREHKLAEPPRVRVIALRASARKPREGASEGGEGAGRHLTCRFTVSGHPRLQRCGPGRKDVKLIWIDPYPKGPADAPFRTREKVYAVIR